jgi:hypothetical protein
MTKFVPALLALAVPMHHATAQPVDDLGRWHAGAYSYSDERGGFAIVDISGSGTSDDPVVLTQEFFSASPVTLVIRAASPIRPREFGGGFANGFIHLRIVALNNSGLPWLEFEFELQEQLGEPSTFGDGLSFDQRRTESDNIWSDLYVEYNRDFEPYDRLVFSNGHTDPLETVTFQFLITDFTPKSVFYLVQDPTVPFS